jgi:DNA-binding NarL/FixJ family response regulator
MDAPPVQYVTTSDGYSIAYSDHGEGRPVVIMPLPFNHLQNISPLYEPLSHRFRLVRYDSRGQGMSSRGLRPDHRMDDFLIDLEAVIERTGFERFVLHSGAVFSHVAVSYAAQHPDRVVALILSDVSYGDVWKGLTIYEQLARESWDVFLETVSATTALRRTADRGQVREYYRSTITQADLLRIFEGGKGSGETFKATLPALRMPVLVIATQDLFGGLLAEDAQQIAAVVPDARLVMLEKYGDRPSLILAIERFLEGIPQERFASPISARRAERDQRSRVETGVTQASNAAPQVGLSVREIEVLRLLAAGKSNAQIAAELVISQNTVIRHVSNIFAKIGVENRTEAASYAHRQGLA